MISVFFKGMGMGAADVVPGVSGGTIAFITGIYQKLIDSLRALTAEVPKKLFSEGVAAAWKAANGTFLITLLSGIALSVLSLAKGIGFLLAHYPVLVWSFFFGLIAASAWVIGRSIARWNGLAILLMLLGVGIAYYITIASPAQTSEASWFIFLSGSLAICAMILPGISGSFILLLLGKYEFILEALSGLNFKVIIIFMLGCAAGLLSFARLLSWLFKHYRNAAIAMLTGFMLGSLNKVWPWKETLLTVIDRHGEEVPLKQESVWPWEFSSEPQLWPAIGCALAGAILILLIEKRGAKAQA